MMAPARLLFLLSCLFSTLGATVTETNKLYQRRAYQNAVNMGGFLYLEGGVKSYYLDSGRKKQSMANHLLLTLMDQHQIYSPQQTLEARRDRVPDNPLHIWPKDSHIGQSLDRRKYIV
uniref:Uncharacterized protein n=1 Tax=Bionectria ochroleuca TaxID=29856 RepID=A0A8H7K956_BIOOC